MASAGAAHPITPLQGEMGDGVIEAAAGMAAALVADAEFPVLLFWWLAISQRVAHLAHQQPAAGHSDTWESLSLVLATAGHLRPQHP